MTDPNKPLIVKPAGDVRLGVFCGLLLATLFCAWAILIFLFKGNQPFEANQTSLGKTLATYLLAGAIGGLLVGIGLQFAKHLWGAALVGLSAASSVWFVLGWSIDPRQSLLHILKSSVILGAAFGLPIGIGFWYQARRYQRTGKWS